MKKQPFYTRATNAIKSAFSIRRSPPNVPQPDPDDPSFYSYDIQQYRNTVNAAYACVNVLTDALVCLDKRVCEKSEDGFLEFHEDYPVAALLRRPSQVMDASQFWRLLIRPYVQYGNSYAIIRRNRKGWPIELLPAYAQYVRRGRGRRLEYGLVVWGQQAGTFNQPNWSRLIVRDERDVISLNGHDYDGINSPSPIEQAYINMDTIQLALQQANTSLKRGISGSMILQSKDTMIDVTPEKRKEALKSLKEQYEGADKSGKTILLPPGIEVARTGGFSAVDLELIRLLRWNVEEVCRVFNVPPRMVQHFTEGSRVPGSSFESQAEDFYRWSIQPRMDVIKTQLTDKLLPSYLPGAERMEIHLDAKTMRQGTFSMKVDTIEKAVTRGGLITINEGRKELGYPPIEGGDRLLEPKGAPAQDNPPPPQGDGAM